LSASVLLVVPARLLFVVVLKLGERTVSVPEALTLKEDMGIGQGLLMEMFGFFFFILSRSVKRSY